MICNIYICTKILNLRWENLFNIIFFYVPNFLLKKFSTKDQPPDATWQEGRWNKESGGGRRISVERGLGRSGLSPSPTLTFDLCNYFTIQHSPFCPHTFHEFPSCHFHRQNLYLRSEDPQKSPSKDYFFPLFSFSVEFFFFDMGFR